MGAEEDAVVFQFRLTDSGAVLELKGRDVTNLELMVRTTGLDQLDTDAVQECFLEAAVEGALTKKAFDQCVRDLVPGATLSHIRTGDIVTVGQCRPQDCP